MHFSQITGPGWQKERSGYAFTAIQVAQNIIATHRPARDHEIPLPDQLKLFGEEVFALAFYLGNIDESRCLARALVTGVLQNATERACFILLRSYPDISPVPFTITNNVSDRWLPFSAQQHKLLDIGLSSITDFQGGAFWGAGKELGR